MELQRNDVLFSISAALFVALMVPLYEIKGVIIVICALFISFLTVRYLESLGISPYIFVDKNVLLFSILISAYFALYSFTHEKGSEIIRTITAYLNVPEKLFLSGYSVFFGGGTLYFCFCLYGMVKPLLETNNSFLIHISAKRKKQFLLLCYIIAIIALTAVVIDSLHADIWEDEICSLITASRGYKEIIELTAIDVHPPLYYIILKFVSEFIISILPISSYAVAGKIVSIIPLLILLIFIHTKVRIQYGAYCESCFILLCAGTYQILLYSVEIRMYSWALLFVTIDYFLALDVINGNNHKHWIFYTIFSLLAAYTHIYAFISAGFIYIFVLVSMLVSRKFSISSILKKWICYSLVAGLLYAPWIFVILSQMRTMSDDGYWIDPITITSFVGYFNFLFGRLSLIPLFILIIYVYIKKKVSIPNETVGGLLVPIGVIIVGTLVSIAFMPSFVPRYLLPVLLLVNFSLVILFSKDDCSALKVIAAMSILFIAVGNIVLFVDKEKILSYNDDMFRQISEFSSDDIIVSNDWFLARCINSERKNSYYCGSEIFNNDYEKNLFSDIVFIEDIKSVQCDNDTKIYFLSYEERKDIDLLTEFDYDDKTAYLYMVE